MSSIKGYPIDVVQFRAYYKAFEKDTDFFNKLDNYGIYDAVCEICKRYDLTPPLPSDLVDVSLGRVKAELEEYERK